MAAFTACSGDKNCYEVNIEYMYKTNGNSHTEKKFSSEYIYNTEMGVNLAIMKKKEALLLEGCYNVKATKQKVNKSEYDCKNPY